MTSGPTTPRMQISASTVKYWFQYRCDRKLVYDSMPSAVRNAIPIQQVHQKGPWADYGVKFEQEVVERLRLERPVVGPAPGTDVLSDSQTLAFLGGELPHTAAHQLRLRETPLLRAELALPDSVRINEGRPDLVLAATTGSRRTFRIVDVKATQIATVFHKAQVAFYSLVLDALLRHNGIDAAIEPEGEIWHVPPSGAAGGEPWVSEGFELAGYAEAVRDFFRRDVPRAAGQEVGRDRDQTFFHVYYKCEQCFYLPHCERTVLAPDPAVRDVSAIPGITQESKRSLLARGVRSVAEFARLAPRDVGDTWALQSRATYLLARARALASGEASRLPDRYTWLMPPRVDVAIHLVADRDPGDGVLVALGCLVRKAGSPGERTVEVMARGEEGEALKRVLWRVAGALGEVDRHNAAGASPPLHAHIYLYDPSEARDLQEALGRHLDDPKVRGGLLDLVRMFPPEDTPAPEPGYRSTHHLPATAVRSVVEQLYALPVPVSYDLASVSRALPGAGLARTYEPAATFAHRFSSRLSVDQTQHVLHRSADVKAVREDVEARLDVLAALVDWIGEDDRRADPHFLRLRKNPFRFQRQFDPLSTTALDVLRAQELLASRADRLAVLAELARPASERIARFRCRGGLVFVDDGADARGDHFLRFRVPDGAPECDVGPGTFAVILTDDDPDLRLDPRRWGEVEVSIVRDEGAAVTVKVAANVYDGPTFQDLRRRWADGALAFLDEVHRDLNADRLEEFLVSLSGA